MTKSSLAVRHFVLNKRDPSGTTGVVKKFSGQFYKRFRWLKGEIRRNIYDLIGEDAPVDNVVTNYDYPRSEAKAEQFMEWLEAKQERGVLKTYEGPGQTPVGHKRWTDMYVDTAYRKGMRDAYGKGGYKKATGWEEDDYVDSAFLTPIHADRLGLLYTRTYEELKGVTRAMDQQMGRTLAQGMADGRNPLDIARDLNKDVDNIGIKRARTIARSEVIRSHAEASLNTFEQFGEEGVTVKAEWVTAGDADVCTECLAKATKTYTIKEARGLIPFHPNCFIDPQVPIYTSDGWKPIGSVEVGDMVLTHKKRFRKVYGLPRSNAPKGTDLVRVDLGGKQRSFSVTSNHEIYMADGTWREAKDLKPGMEMMILANECARCGELTPFWKKYCSRTCLSKDITERQWADPEHRKTVSTKNSKSMYKQYRHGFRDKDRITKAANEKMRDLKSQGVWGWWMDDSFYKKMREATNTPKHRRQSSERMKQNNPMMHPEIRRKATIAFNKTLDENPEKRINNRMAKHRKSGKKTWIEQRVGDVLDSLGVDYVFQYPILRYNVDFAIPALGIVIECDGEYWHQDKEKDARRQRRIEDQGWLMLRYSGSKINQRLDEVRDELSRVVGNHTGEYKLMPWLVESVKLYSAKKGKQLYNLSVEEDESYVAKGAVVHNCRCVWVPIEPEDIEEDKDKFPEDTAEEHFEDDIEEEEDK